MGNIYGTNVYGGANGGGTVFELTPNAAKTAWTEKVLYAFCTKTSCSDGAHSYAGLIGDASGNLYGTTINGGANGEGTVFKLAPEGAETVLYALCAKTNCADGANPENFGPLLVDQAGNLSGQPLTATAAWSAAAEAAALSSSVRRMELKRSSMPLKAGAMLAAPSWE